LLPILAKMSEIVRGPAPGPGRSSWVKYNGMVYTVGVPKGREADATIEDQTSLTISMIGASGIPFLYFS